MSALLLGFSGFLLGCVGLLIAYYNHRIYYRRILELRKRTLQAQRNLRHLGNLASEVAHEIKNPITAILCSAETLDLLIGDDIDPTHRKSLRYIRDYGDNLLRLVSDFLDVSRAETGHIEARPTSVEILPAIESIVGLLQTNAQQKNIAVEILQPEEGLFVYADGKHMKQVLFNLIHNAIKFTDNDGKIQIAVEQDFPHPTVKIAVRDNGCGIENDVARSLFTPYISIKDEKNASGVGLGLSLCKSLVELNGGEISVQSSPGVGSSFEFTVPMHEADEVQAELPQVLEPQHKPLIGQKFLIVDEHNGSREALSRLVEAWGGMVDRVSLAVDAVDALTEKSYDAVMIDDAIDGVYAYELARIIREDLDDNETTVIVATEDRLRSQLLKQSCADKCIEKPLSGKTLLDALLHTGKYSTTH